MYTRGLEERMLMALPRLCYDVQETNAALFWELK